MKYFIKPLFYILFLIPFNQVFAQQIPLGTEFFGNASYYGKEFYGHKTANGEKLKIEEFTCAHPTLPFGTMIEVTNLQNNKWVVVRVNDRGPYAKGRIIDVTHTAAQELRMFGAGIIKVKLTIVGDNGTVYISRPQTMIENTTELIAQDFETLAIPLKPEEEVVNVKHKKEVAKKRAKRRKEN